MRIQLNTNSKELIEKDHCFSIANYGSRKNYVIEAAMLKKRLVFDNSLIVLLELITVLHEKDKNFLSRKQ